MKTFILMISQDTVRNYDGDRNSAKTSVTLKKTAPNSRRKFPATGTFSLVTSVTTSRMGP
jgi:hypothetical protein